jgi:hypothetical protein
VKIADLLKMKSETQGLMTITNSALADEFYNMKRCMNAVEVSFGKTNHNIGNLFF